MSRRPEAIAKLDNLGIDEFCALLIEGQSYRKIAADLQIGPASIVEWLGTDSERSARARQARITSAQAADERAEEVLMDKTIDPARARELAFHYRWRARVVNPKEYGDKVQVDSTIQVSNLSLEEIELRRQAIAAQIAADSRPPELPPPDDVQP